MTQPPTPNRRQPLTPETVDAVVLNAHEAGGSLSPWALEITPVQRGGGGIIVTIGDQPGPLFASGGAMLAVATYVGARLNPANVTTLAAALRTWADHTAAAPIAVTPRTAQAIDTSPAGHILVQSPPAPGLLFVNLGPSLHLWANGTSELNSPLTADLADHLDAWVANVRTTMAGVN